MAEFIRFDQTEQSNDIPEYIVCMVLDAHMRGFPVAVPRFHIEYGEITDTSFVRDGYVGITGKTTGGFQEYRNMHFHFSELEFN